METTPEGISKEEGLRLLKSGQVDEAIKVLKELSQTESDDPQIFTYLGAAYNQKGDRLHAINAFEKSVDLEETPKSLYNLGLIYEQCERLQEAIWQYDNALKLDPSYTQAQQAIDRIKEAYRAAHPELNPPPPAEETSDAEATQAMPGQPEATIHGNMPGGQFTPPPHGPPDHAAEHAARMAKKEQATIEQHHKLMKSGLIYGIVCGAIFVLLSYLAVSMLTFSLPGNMFLALFIVIIIGGIYGGIIGFWIGYTSGGEEAGMRAGAVMGALLGLVLGLISGGGVAVIIIAMLANGFISGLGGMFIGRMVDASIGWD